jgi:hypothetical protein
MDESFRILIDSPRSKLRGIIDPVKEFYIYLLANPAAKLRGLRSPGLIL